MIDEKIKHEPLNIAFAKYGLDNEIIGISNVASVCPGWTFTI